MRRIGGRRKNCTRSATPNENPREGRRWRTASPMHASAYSASSSLMACAATWRFASAARFRSESRARRAARVASDWFLILLLGYAACRFPASSLPTGSTSQLSAVRQCAHTIAEQIRQKASKNIASFSVRGGQSATAAGIRGDGSSWARRSRADGEVSLQGHQATSGASPYGH